MSPGVFLTVQQLERGSRVDMDERSLVRDRQRARPRMPRFDEHLRDLPHGDDRDGVEADGEVPPGAHHRAAVSPDARRPTLDAATWIEEHADLRRRAACLD